MRSLFIWLSGADQTVLARVPSERPRYEGLGGVVLTTATLAGISCAFALHAAVRVPIPFAVILGIFWGLAILNLDRWLISSTPRRDTVLKNFAQILPRLLVALIIGIVVSTPLTLQVFQSEINQQLEVIQQRDQDEFNKKVETQYGNIAELQTKYDYYHAAEQATQDSPVVRSHSDVVAAAKAVDAARTARDKAQATYNEEQNSGSVSAGTANALATAQGTLDGRIRSYNLTRDAVVQELRAEGAANVEQAKEALDTAKSRRDAAKTQFRTSNEDRTGLLARLEALRELTSSNPTLKRAYLMLALLITTIEILPVLVKFMMTFGRPNAYERTLALVEAASEREAEDDLEAESEDRSVDRRFRSTRREEEARSKEAVERAERDRRLDEELARVNAGRRDPNSRFGPM